MDNQPKIAIRKKKEDNISLYVGASALFISVVTVVFFYREIRKMKKEIGDIKQIKNQIANVDSRFDVMDSSIEELAQLIKSQKTKVQFKTPIETTLKLPIKEEECESESEVESLAEE